MLRTFLARSLTPALLAPLAVLACSPARPPAVPPPAPSQPLAASQPGAPSALSIHVLIPALEPRVKKTLEFRPAFGCSKDAFDIVVPVLRARWGETVTLGVDAPAALTGTVETFAGSAAGPAGGKERFATPSRSAARGSGCDGEGGEEVTRLMPYQSFAPDLARATTLARVAYTVDGTDASRLPRPGTIIRFRVVPSGVLDFRKSVFVVKQIAEEPNVDDAVWTAYLGSGGGAAWERLEVARCAAMTRPDELCEREGMSFAEVVRQRDYRRCGELLASHRLDAQCQKEGWMDSSVVVAVAPPAPPPPPIQLQPPPPLAPPQPLAPPPPVAVLVPVVVAPAPPMGAPPPPPPVFEQVPPPPQVDVEWVPGAWAWAGGQWTWRAGSYRRGARTAPPAVTQQPSRPRPASPPEPRRPGPEHKAPHR